MMYDAAMSAQLKEILDIILVWRSQSRVNIRIGYAMICETLECAEGLSPYEPLTEFKNVYHGKCQVGF